MANTMNQQQFVDFYINDLSTTGDPSHNRSLKVREPSHWKALGEAYGQQQTNINLADQLEQDNVWIWSDLHFNHNNIISYSNRPFESKEHMGDSLIASGNQAPVGSVLIFGGDLVFGGQEVIDNTLKRIVGMKKVHVIGNHDINRKGVKQYDYGMDETLVCIAIPYKDRTIYITHYPLETIPGNGINVHGHTHQWLMNKPGYINMCVEHTNYQPISLKQLLNDHGI